MNKEKICEATHEELCDGMLRHYRKLSNEACNWNSGVEEAIEFYKKYGNKLQMKNKFGQIIAVTLIILGILLCCYGFFTGIIKPFI